MHLIIFEKIIIVLHKYSASSYKVFWDPQEKNTITNNKKKTIYFKKILMISCSDGILL